MSEQDYYKIMKLFEKALAQLEITIVRLRATEQTQAVQELEEVQSKIEEAMLLIVL